MKKVIIFIKKNIEWIGLIAIIIGILLILKAKGVF
jgi:Trk-type K+ transport system membrane component